MIATTEKLRPWLEEFESFHRQGSGPGWLQGLRAKAFARFYELGFPTVKDEDWRFTSLQPVANNHFALAASGEAESLQALGIQLPEGFACHLIFVDGCLDTRLTKFGQLPPGVVVEGIASLLERAPERIERHLGKYAALDSEAFTALNTALLADGAYVFVPRGVALEKPIHLLYITTSGPERKMTHPRNLIVVEEDAQATLVEDYITAGAPQVEGISSFANAVTELVVGDNGVVSHYRVERENAQAAHVATLRIQQGRSANVASHALLLGGGLVRNNVHPVLAGEGSECLINGLFLGQGTQHLDNYMKVEHQSPRCQSRQFYNGILDGQAHGVFHGRIIVHKDAQKTDAKQTNRNLVLSDFAQIDTKPQLEIYADDVKCTHGATIGQIDETALFYLRSRGVPDSEARSLLLYAFAHENLERMKPAAVREWLSELIGSYLPTGVGHPEKAEATARSWQEAG